MCDLMEKNKDPLHLHSAHALKISFENTTVELNIFDISKQAAENEDVNEVYMVESLVHGTFIESSYEELYRRYFWRYF
jgi:hypothetical protein